MKKSALCLGIVWLMQQMSMGQLVALYTNAPDGSTITLSQNVAVTNSPASTTDAAGITFADGSGFGELTGSGDFSVYNMATTNQGGATILYGIHASTLAVSNYTGNITVVNDRNFFIEHSETFVSAFAYGVDGDLVGDVSGMISAMATGGTAYSEGGYSSADATRAYGVNGNVSGDVSGLIRATASGGSTVSSSADHADAHAYGVFGDVDGDVGGTIGATAIGGIACYAYAVTHGVVGNVSGDVSGMISATATGGNADSENDDVAVYSIAFGVLGDVEGDVNGAISATATGGNADSINGNASVYAYAYGVCGDVVGDVDGTINATATGGSVDFEDDYALATANAYGVGNVSGDVSGTISATATGGIASVYAGDSSADAHAYGVGNVSGDVSGTISATAIAGLEIRNGVTNVAEALACGIAQSDALTLNVNGGTIHAEVFAPDGHALGDLAEGSGAYSIYGWGHNDSVLLNQADIVGDIDLGLGINQIDVLGDTRIRGDIYARYSGLNNFQIMSGLLTPVGSVRVSNLLDDQLNIASAGGLAFELYEDATNSLNSKLVVEGGVVAGNGASIAAFTAVGQAAANMIGNSYEVITAKNGVEGTFVESSKSLFSMNIDVGSTNVTITPTGLRRQDGENTPSGGSSVKVATSSAQAVMGSLSAHAGSMRSILRSGAGPDGAQGPEIGIRRRMESGEWQAYVHQLNYLGSQDSEGGLAGYDWNSHGFMVEAEKLMKKGLVIGAAAGGVWSSLDGSDGAGGGGSDLFMGSLYGNWFTETCYAELGLSYGHAWNDAERVAPDTQRYSGDFESDLYGVWLEAGHTLFKGDNQLEPYGRTTYISGHHDGYTDAGGTAPLTVDANSTDNWQTEFGVRGKREWAMKCETYFRLALKAGWRREWLDNHVGANGRMLGIDIPLDSPKSDRDALVLSVKADWELMDSVNIGLEYEPVLSGNWFYHNINGSLSLTF